MSVPKTTREWHIPQSSPEGPRALKLGESEIKPLLATQVLVKVHAVSLQYTDISITLGRDGVGAVPGVIPCSDMAGEVVAVGPEVKSFKVGDRVAASRILDHIHGDAFPGIFMTASGCVIDGVLAEYRPFPEHSLVIIPEHLSYEEASTLPCAAVTAWNCLFGPKPIKGGDYVLVQGTGGVSIFATQFASACGANVIITSSSDEKLKIAEKYGAKHFINYKKTPDWDKEVMKITNGLGAEHIIELGGSGTLKKSIGAVAIAGWIHAVGFLDNAVDDVNVTRESIAKCFILRGIFIGPVTSFNDMNKLISSHKLRPLIDKVFPFDEAIEAYEYLGEQKHVGKVVIKVA